MEFLIKIILGILIGIMSGHYIDKISNKLISEETERKKKYNINKKILIAATVFITVAVLIKLDWVGFIHYGIVGLILLLIGIIDHYTHYVYLIISIPTLVFSLSLGLYFNGVYSLIAQLPFITILFIIAFFTNKFYGDIEVMLIVGAISGIFGLMIVIFLAAIFTIPEMIKHRKEKSYSIAFCTYIAISYYIILIVI